MIKGDCMKTLLYKDKLYNARELAELTGVKYTTLIERLKRGYSVEEAVADEPRVPQSIYEFVQNSSPLDWNGLTTDDFYKIYFQWCVRNEYAAETKVHFIRNIRRLYPNLKVTPARLKRYDGVVYKRIVRFQGGFWNE